MEVRVRVSSWVPINSIANCIALGVVRQKGRSGAARAQNMHGIISIHRNLTPHCMSTTSDSLRIDRWLYYCRFFKTRSKASAAVTGGHVKINGERTTPGNRVKCGDQIDLVRERLLYSLDVVKIPNRRGPASEARSCYLEDEETMRKREIQVAALKQDRLLTPRTDGRPDKHTRRQLRERNRR